MAIETHLRLRGKLRSGAPALPDVIVELARNLDWVPFIEGDRLDFDEMFKDRGGIVEPMLAWAAKSLVELERGSMHSDASDDGHFVYRFDAKTPALVEEPSEPDPSCFFCRLQLEEEGHEFDEDEGDTSEVESVSIPTPQWRRKFAELLDFMADLEKQRWAFKTKEHPFIIKWWDLIDLYFTVFDLQKGVLHAEDAGRLTPEEGDALAAYHEALIRYRDLQLQTQANPLDDPKWAQICELAKMTRAKLPLED